jgi:hypothetical protein
MRYTDWLLEFQVADFKEVYASVSLLAVMFFVSLLVEQNRVGHRVVRSERKKTFCLLHAMVKLMLMIVLIILFESQCP